MKGASLTLVRRFRAPPAQVFQACSDPSLMARWFGPRGWTVTDLEADVRVGGKLTFRMVGPEGALGAEGVYEAIDPPTRLVHTWRWIEDSNAVAHAQAPEVKVSRVIMLLQRTEDGGTELTFTHEGLADSESAQEHKVGWNESLEKLTELLD